MIISNPCKNPITVIYKSGCDTKLPPGLRGERNKPPKQLRIAPDDSLEIDSNCVLNLDEINKQIANCGGAAARQDASTPTRDLPACNLRAQTTNLSPNQTPGCRGSGMVEITEGQELAIVVTSDPKECATPVTWATQSFPVGTTSDASIGLNQLLISVPGSAPAGTYNCTVIAQCGNKAKCECKFKIKITSTPPPPPTTTTG